VFFPGTENPHVLSARLCFLFLTNAAVVPRQCRPRGSSTASRRTPVAPFARSFFRSSRETVARFDRTMPAFVTPRRGPESRGQSLVNVSAQSDATHPGETPDPGEAWPLPKRLRVRLQTSAERFGKETALDERLRLAERLQVRAHRRTRVACLPRVCFSTERRFAFRARAPGRARGTRRARAPRPRASARGDFEAERVPALRAPRLPSHARGVRARGPSET